MHTFPVFFFLLLSVTTLLEAPIMNVQVYSVHVQNTQEASPHNTLSAESLAPPTQQAHQCRARQNLKLLCPPQRQRMLPKGGGLYRQEK